MARAHVAKVFSIDGWERPIAAIAPTAPQPLHRHAIQSGHRPYTPSLNGVPTRWALIGWCSKLPMLLTFPTWTANPVFIMTLRIVPKNIRRAATDGSTFPWHTKKKMGCFWPTKLLWYVIGPNEGVAGCRHSTKKNDCERADRQHT